MPRRVLLLVALALGVLPASASAHGGTGMPAATDARVEVTRVAPAVPGLRAEVVGNDFQMRLKLPDDALVVVNRTAGGRPLRATGGTLTWRDDRLRHPRPDGSVQIGFTLNGAPVVVDLVSRPGSRPSPLPALALGLLAVVAGILRPRLASTLAVSAFAVMLVGAAGGLLEGRGAVAPVVACVLVVVLSVLAAAVIAAVPELFRTLAAGAVAATALLLAMAQVPMLYRAYPVSVLPDSPARILEALAVALALGALAAVVMGRPWRLFEQHEAAITPVG